MTTREVLQQAEKTVLEQLTPGEAASVSELEGRLEDRVKPGDVRKAVWSLVATGKVSLTPEFRVLRLAR